MQQNTEIRVWTDGCYDFTHFGHANILRQAKKLGTKLIVGVHSDEDIRRNKRSPVYSQDERVKLIKAMKWTDDVIEGAPYVTTLDTLDRYKCHFAVHGNDKTTCNGEDTYNLIKQAQRYKEVERTAGISTTGLIDRMLRYSTEMGDVNHSESVVSQYTGRSPFLQTSRKIYEFVNDTTNPPKPTDKIIYVAGTFDLFHVGHLDFLEKAKSRGDYLLVGLYGDDPSSKTNCSILNLNERMMNLLSCKYVNEVLIDAPRKVTEDLMDHFNVGMVYHGRFPCSNSDLDPYEIHKKMGKFDDIDSGSDVTTDTIIERIKKYDEQYRITNRLNCSIKRIKLVRI